MNRILRFNEIFQKLVLLVLTIFLSAGCTRPSGQSSLVSLELPHSMSAQTVGAQSFDKLAHISLNVTGEGIAQPIVFSWDGGDKELAAGGEVAAPTSFTLEIPQGSNRLIQLLAVYRDSSTTGSMQFFYGDVTRNLNLQEEVIDIEVKALSASTQFVDGQVMGRYLTGPNQGPTGRVDILYSPVGKPGMIIDSGVMINGWFSVFMLSQVPFSYRLPDGSLLWNGPVDLNSPLFGGNGSTLRVSIPTHQRNETYSGAALWRQENPQVYIYGWFGAAALTAGKLVCDTPSPSTLTRLASGANSAAMLSRVAGAPPANLFDSNLASFYTQGGTALASAGTACIDSTSIASARFNSVLDFSPTLIDGQGKDRAAGFSGPFITSSTGGLLDVATTTTGKTLTGVLLPGASQVIDEFSVFKKPALEHPHSNYAPCGALSFGGMGFVPAGKGAVTGEAVSLNVLVSPEEAAAGVLLAICPSRAGKLYDIGFWMGPSYFSSSGGGGGGSITNYLRLEFQNSGYYNASPGSVVLTQGQCYPANARLYQNGTPINYASAGGLNLTALSATFGGFYTDSGCGTALVPPLNIPQGSSSSSQIYFRADSLVASGSFQVTLSDPAFGFPALSEAVFVEKGKLKLKLPNKIVQDVCYPFDMEYVYAAGDSGPGFKISSGAIGSGDFNLSPGSGGTIYPSANCTGTPNTSPAMSNGQVSLSYKASDSSTKTVSAMASGTPGAASLVSTLLVGNGGQIIDHVLATPVMSSINPGQCNTIRLSLLNYDGAEIPAPYAFDITLSTTIPGSLFTDPSCSTSGNAVSFAIGERDRHIGFIPAIANVGFSLNLTSGRLSATAAMTVVDPSQNSVGIDPNYIYALAPSLNGKKTIGSHEFPISVPLHFTAGSTNLQCSTDGSTFSNCTGVVDGGNNYIWTASDALTDQPRYFRVTLPSGTQNKTYKFRPTEIYGPKFKAYQCDFIQNTSTGFTNINSSFGSYNVICLDAGVMLTKSSGGDQITLSANGGKALIGHSSGNSIDVASLYSTGSPNIIINNDISSRNPVVANLNFINIAPGDSFLGLGSGLIATVSRTIRVTGNTFTVGGGISMTTQGIRGYAFSDPDISLEVIGNSFVLSSPVNGGGQTFGMYFKDSDMGGNLFLNNSYVGSGPAVDCQITGVQVETLNIPISNFSFEGMKWQGNGCPLVAKGYDNTKTIGNFTLTNANLELNSMAASTSAATGVRFENVVSFNLRNNRFVWSDFAASGVDALVRMSVTAGSASGTFSNNVLSGVKDTTYGWLSVYSGVTINGFDHNQFVYRDLVPGTLSFAGIYNISTWFNSNSTPAHGNNLFCSDSGNIWSTIFQNASSGTFSSSLGLSKCTRANDVNATSGMCQTPCSP